MDPMRRRLTVSQCADASSPGLAGKGAGKGEVDPAEKLGLAGILAQAGEDKKRAIAIASRTDSLMNKKRAFATKDEIRAFVPGASDEDKAETTQWLQSTVGWTCHKGKKPEQANQDCMTTLVVEEDFALYGVYDGHGPLGHDVSEFVAETLPSLFLEKKGQLDGDVVQAFGQSFVEMQAMIEGNSGLDAQMSGTTCTMAFHCMKSKKLWLSHVGDSRSIIGSVDGKSCAPLTVDHKPDLPEEKKRIESANPPGRVIFDGFFNHRVFAQKGMYPGLNMSRAMGDIVAHKQAGLTAMPDVKEIDLASSELGGTGERLLILCTDGVWEFINDEEALDHAFKAMSGDKGDQPIQAGIAALAKLGYDRWLADSDDEISDDITGIMVRLP